MITHKSFPTPDLAQRTHDREALASARAFAFEQAAVADLVRWRLHATVDEASSVRVRQALLRSLFVEVASWRWHLAVNGWSGLGVGLPPSPDRFRLSIDEAGPNLDRIGRVERFCPDGMATPAFEVLANYGEAASSRFVAEEVYGDVLRNRVTLPDGQTLVGNRLVRGESARKLADVLAKRLVARGVDPAAVNVGDDPMFVVTGSSSARRRCHEAALRTLAAAKPGDLSAWQAARYLHYQGVRRKRGSDAVTRVWLVAAATWLLGRAPVLERDCDLRCMVLGQDAATYHPADDLLPEPLVPTGVFAR